MSMEFDIKGSNLMMGRLRMASKDFPRELSIAVRRVVESDILTPAKERLVPVDFGPLRSSGTVLEPVVKGDTISVTVAFGGPAAPYALAVHEHPSEHSPPSWKGKDIVFSPASAGPKFLEKAVKETERTVARRVADEVRDIIGER